MTTSINSNLTNPKLSGFIKPYSNLYKSGYLDFDLIIAKCADTVEEIKENKLGKTPDLIYGKFLRLRDILELNIAAKEHYYTHAFFGKIDAFVQTFFKDKFGFSTSIEKATTVLNTCKKGIGDLLRDGLEPAVKEERNLRSAVDLSRMYAFTKKQVYVHSVEGKPEKPHGEILFAKPNGDVYYLSRLGNPLAKGASRQVYQGDLHTPGSKHTPFSKKKIAILTTMPVVNLSQCKGNTRPEKEKEIKINTQNMQREQTQLRQLKNIKGIIHNQDFFVTQVDNVPMGFAMTDLYELGDLNKFLNSLKEKNSTLSETAKLSLMQSLSKTINDLHSQKKIHRDFKDKNIVVAPGNKNGELKTVLLDFESCIDSNDKKRKKEMVGTPEYMSPEYFEACATNDDSKIAIAIANATNPAMDMWGLGLIYYRICYGKDLTALSPGNTRAFAVQATFNYIEAGQNDTTIFPDDLMGRTIKQMLAIDPKKRLTASQLNQLWALHPKRQ